MAGFPQSQALLYLTLPQSQQPQPLPQYLHQPLFFFSTLTSTSTSTSFFFLLNINYNFYTNPNNTMDSSRKGIDPYGEAPTSRVVSTSSSASIDLSKREINSHERAPSSQVVSTSSSASIDLSKRKIDSHEEAPTSQVVSISSSVSMSSSIPTATTLVSLTSGSTSTSISISAGVPIFAPVSYAPFDILPLELTLNSKAKAIDPDGDVLIASGSTATKLLVSSKILSIASPFFKKIFFLCGKDIPELLEIQFFDDSPSTEALEIVFCLLHHRHECVSADITHDTLYGIALMGYWYGLISALGP